MTKYKTRLMYSNYEHYKACYDAWFSEGSLERAKDKLAREGVLNSYGRPYSLDGVRKSAVRYMVANPVESMKMLLESYRKQGYIVEKENIERYMIKLAVSVLCTEEAVVEWLKETGLYGKHIKFIDSLIAISYDD